MITARTVKKYFIEVATPQFLATIMEKENNAFLLPDYPCIIVIDQLE